MSKTRRRYTQEFKDEALQLWETSGKTRTQLERELGIGHGNLTRWRQEKEEDEGQAARGQKQNRAEIAEIRRLRRELEITKQERDILKKALAIFSAEER